jgi:hypothetical protein
MLRQWLARRRHPWQSCEREGHLVYDAVDGLRCARCGCNITLADLEVSPR